MTEIGELGKLSNPRKGDPDIGAIDAIVSLISAAVMSQKVLIKYFINEISIKYILHRDNA